MSLLSFVRGLFHDNTNPFTLPHVWYEGGDGSTIDDAIIVRGAGSDLEGVAATFGWMHEHLGAKDDSWQLISHSSGGRGARQIDTFNIVLRGGTAKLVYFDVTESFENGLAQVRNSRG